MEDWNGEFIYGFKPSDRHGFKYPIFTLMPLMEPAFSPPKLQFCLSPLKDMRRKEGNKTTTI